MRRKQSLVAAYRDDEKGPEAVLPSRRQGFRSHWKPIFPSPRRSLAALSTVRSLGGYLSSEDGANLCYLTETNHSPTKILVGCDER